MAEQTNKAVAQGKTQYSNPYDTGIVIGYKPMQSHGQTYHEVIKRCRHFYKFDPIASTVINRMVDMSITNIRHRKRGIRNTTPSDEATVAYYNAVVYRMKTFLKRMATDYLLHGMSIPEYSLSRIRGDLLAEPLGRKKVFYPAHVWTRNIDNIRLKKRPFGDERAVLLDIPQEDIDFIRSKGKNRDGVDDSAAYKELVEKFPEYVAAIQNGQTTFLLEDVHPIYRKLNAFDVYPTPYLQAALEAMAHKVDLKTMDRSIASRAIESIRHVKIGTDTFPATNEDIEAAQKSLETSGKDRVFNWITPHTYDMGWVYPPLDVLANEMKYSEPNADIFLALGFPRILVAGETLRSNASDASVALLGPKSTLTDMRDAILEWLQSFYEVLAEKNSFVRIPEPYFAPLQTGDMTSLVQFAVQAMQGGAISKDTVAQLYDTSWDIESPQIVEEQNSGVLSPTELASQRLFENQQQLGGQSTDPEDSNSRDDNDGNSNQE